MEPVNEERATITQLFMNEWQTIFQNKTIKLIVFAVPLIYFILFGFLYSEKKVQELPTVVVNADQTGLSQELIRAFDQDQSFAVTSVVGSETEAMEMIEQEEAVAAVFIPTDLAAHLKTGSEAEVMVVIDGSNMMISNTVVRAANTVVKSVSAGVTLKQLEAKGQWGEEGKELFTGIDYRYRVLYNPTFSYMSFMVFGLGGTVLQQMLFLAVAISVAVEKEAGTWRETIRKYSFGKLLIGKMTPYLILAMFNLVLTFSILLKGFGIPYYGNPGYLILLGFVFNVVIILMGFAISFFAADQLQATQISMLIALPSFMLSGYTWPLYSMPPVIRMIGESLPLTYFLHGVREILSKGHGLSFLVHDIIVLCFMGMLSITVSYVLYVINKSRIHTSSAAHLTISEQIIEN